MNREEAIEHAKDKLAEHEARLETLTNPKGIENIRGLIKILKNTITNLERVSNQQDLEDYIFIVKNYSYIYTAYLSLGNGTVFSGRDLYYEKVVSLIQKAIFDTIEEKPKEKADPEEQADVKEKADGPSSAPTSDPINVPVMPSIEENVNPLPDIENLHIGGTDSIIHSSPHSV